MRRLLPPSLVFQPFERCCRAILLVVLTFGMPVLARAATQFPELTGRIVDNAGLLGPDERRGLEAEIEALEGKSTDQLVVVTLPSLQGYEIDDFGYQLGRKWGIGQAGKNNGVILIVAPAERKVRIEVGRGLEPLLTDLMSKLIIENAILPAFRRGDFAGGIRAGVRDIKAVLLGDAESVTERARKLGPGPDYFAYLMLAFWIVILICIVYASTHHAASTPQGVKRRRGRASRTDPVVADAGSGSGSWSGGGWSSGGGDSGWSGGGGGDFGGGGASGSW